MDLFADIPSSPLSSAPSDLASRSPSPQPTKPANVGCKRKVPDPAPTKTRATRRKTGDDFQTQLTAIREEIVLPKVKKAAARKAVSKKAVTVTKTLEKAEAAPKAEDVTDVQDDASMGVGSEPVDLENAQVEVDHPEPVIELVPTILPQATDLKVVGDGEVEYPIENRVKHKEGKEGGTIEDEELHRVENKSEAVSEREAIPAVMQEVELVKDEANQQIVGDETTKHAAEKAPEAATENEVESITAKVSKASEDDEEDELAQDKITECLKAKDAHEDSSITVRPSRRRVAPTKLADDYPSPAKTITATSKRKSQPVRGNWSAEHLLTNPKSKLATCNLPVR